jgi:hypothetical protein
LPHEIFFAARGVTFGLVGFWSSLGMTSVISRRAFRLY